MEARKSPSSSERDLNEFVQRLDSLELTVFHGEWPESPPLTRKDIAEIRDRRFTIEEIHELSPNDPKFGAPFILE